jgi:hypothetical protein
MGGSDTGKVPGERPEPEGGPPDIRECSSPPCMLHELDPAFMEHSEPIPCTAGVVHTWWHATVRFEHALQVARDLGAGTAVRSLGRAEWRLWHGRWPGCRCKLGAPMPLGGAQHRARRDWHGQRCASTRATC